MKYFSFNKLKHKISEHFKFYTKNSIEVNLTIVGVKIRHDYK
jgi:hypothetical protein